MNDQTLQTKILPSPWVRQQLHYCVCEPNHAHLINTTCKHGWKKITLVKTHIIQFDSNSWFNEIGFVIDMFYHWSLYIIMCLFISSPWFLIKYLSFQRLYTIICLIYTIRKLVSQIYIQLKNQESYPTNWILNCTSWGIHNP